MVRYNRRALKRLLGERGLRPDAVARQARLSRQTVYYIVLGATVPKADTLAKIATALGVGVDSFFQTTRDAA